tara:strand:+ start:536 stop:727 length:192 start_codon:yes stop_codon:yes gene_type:complete
MSKREKAIEICKNLKQTIKKIGNRRIVESLSSAYEATRASKRKLNKIYDELQEKYSLTKKELK